MADWWHVKALAELNPAEWEALCDGCARCCLHKLEDADTGELFHTRIRCRYLDERSCRCTDYANRLVQQPQCIELRQGALDDLDWLPDTCAYRLRARGERLPEWHPLISGDPQSVHRSGISVRGRSVSEEHVHPDGYDEHVVRWIK